MASHSIIGVDIGGTKIGFTRFDADTWAILEEKRMPTDAARGLPAVIEDVCTVVSELRTEDTIAIGVGIPGPVSNGTLLYAPNIPASANIPLADLLTKKIGLPVSVINDNQGFTYAEAIAGAGKGKSVVVGLALGTGVGGGIVIDGKIVGGAHGSAGEFGHMLLMPGTPPYQTKDARGDVEQFISGKAWGKRCPDAKNATEYWNGAACASLHPSMHREIAWTCASLICALDPDVIVIGGSVGKAMADHLQAIKQELTSWLIPGTPMPEIVVSTLKSAGMLGAAMIASQR